MIVMLGGICIVYKTKKHIFDTTKHILDLLNKFQWKSFHHQAITTFSVYITAQKRDKRLFIRISDHTPPGYIRMPFRKKDNCIHLYTWSRTKTSCEKWLVKYL